MLRDVGMLGPQGGNRCAVLEPAGRDQLRLQDPDICLAVAAPGVHASRIPLDELAKAVQAAKASRGMNVHDGPALDGIRRELGIGGIQPAESARPPLAPRVDVRTGE